MDESPLSRDMLALLFGEAVEYFGDTDALPVARQVNIGRVCKYALTRLGESVSAPGLIPAGIAGALLNEGSYCADSMVQEYWGGIIASSRSARGNDDRGLRQLRLASRLTIHQIRTHYLFYATLRRLLLAHKVYEADFEARRYQMAVFAPAGGYIPAMRFDDEEMKLVNSLVADALTGLGGENLLDGSNTGNESYLKKFIKSDVIRGDGIVYSPSLLGIRLFLWAFGAGDKEYGHLLAPNFNCTTTASPEVVKGAGLVYGEKL